MTKNGNNTSEKKNAAKSVITRTVFLLSLVSLFTDLASELLYPVMPVYLKSIGFSIIIIGVLEGVAEAIAGLTKGYFGQWSDTIGKRMPFVQLGYSLSALSKIMLAFFTSVPAVFSARLLDRIGKGARSAPRDAILSAEAPPEKKATVFGFHRSFDTVGATLGPLAALLYLYLRPGDYKGVILLAAIPGLIAVLFTFLTKEKTIQQPLKKNAGFFSYLNYWKTASASYKKTVVHLFLFAIINSSDVFLLLLLKEKNYSDVQMISFYIFYNLIYAMAAFPVGKLADKTGMKRILISGMLLFAFVYIAINYTNNFYAIGFIFLLYGIYAACFESTSKAIIASQCEENQTATAIGFYSGFASIGALIASLWTGMVWYNFSPASALTLSGIAAVLVAISFLILKRKPSAQLIS